MQEQRSAVGSLPETLGFDHGCTSSDAAIDHQQVRWNDIHSSGHDMLPEYIALHGDPPHVPYLNPTSQGGHNLSGWSVGEPSSGSTQVHPRHNEWKTEHGVVAPMLEERHYEPANTLSLNNVSVNNLSSNQLGHAPLFVQSSSNPILQDLNMTAGFVGHRIDDSVIMDDESTAFKSDASQNSQNPSSDPFRMPSGSGGYLVEGNDGRPGSSMEVQRASCKRKVFDGSIGQSSRSGSPGYFHQAESSHWQAPSGRFNAGSSLSISTPSDNGSGMNLRSAERVNARLGLGASGAASGNSLPVNVEGNANPRRNYRTRTIPAREQDFLPINVFPGSTIGHPNASSRVPPANNNSLNVTPPAAEGSATSQRQPIVVRVPSLRRSSHSSRWNNGSSSRPGHSSSSGVRDNAPHEEPNLPNMPRNISEHPMFIPASERRSSVQDNVNWSSTGGNISFAGNVASSSRTGPTPGVHQVSGSSRVIHRHSQQYPRRLSEFVRRSLLSSIGSESGGQGPSNPPVGGSGSSQEVALPLGAGNHSRLSSHARSAMLVERQMDGTQGMPFSLRTLAAASEGRSSRLVSEIRNVLDLMRRGEGLRFEDVMILDQSVLFGMADIHDRHRDMRLDVDNMSYEELLALEERIGNVNTGLSEETISDRLKRRKFFAIAMSSNLEVEPCCVCQEEYKDGEDVGTLDCGHEFHTDCIKQWLVQKNICPICKTNALSK